MTEIKLHGEFKKWLHPLSEDEYNTLEQSILKHGCYDTIKIWDGYLIDGHHRYQICTKHSLPYQIEEMEFDNQYQVMVWMIDNQDGRRSTNKMQKAELVGKRHKAEKKSKEWFKDRERNPDGTFASGLENKPMGRTSERIADEIGKSKSYVEESQRFMIAAATIEKLSSPEVKDAMLAGETCIQHMTEVKQLASIANGNGDKNQEPDPERAKKMIDEIAAGNVKTVKQAMAKVAPTVKPPKQFITLDDWALMNQSGELNINVSSNKKMNKQSGVSIEWAQWSWNPITGCHHGCNYCYARDIANRFDDKLYPHGFEPVLIPDRLAAPANTKVPKKAKNETGYKNVFTVSMGDLFGEWLPSDWIELVLDVIRDNPQWNFLMLTKNPRRLLDFDFPHNAWVGATVDIQARIKPTEDIFREVDATVKWLSCEPMLEPLVFNDPAIFDWVAIGGASKSTQTEQFYPPREWVMNLERQIWDVGGKVYEKANLWERITEFPSS
jgi:protein gp37